MIAAMRLCGVLFCAHYEWFTTSLVVQVALAGGELTQKHARSLDGHDIWSAITAGEPSPRREILHNIDPVKKEAAVRVGDWKLIVGATNKGWGPKPGTPSLPSLLFTVPGNSWGHNMSCLGTKGLTSDIVGAENESGPWLFNVRDDPTERTNLYGEQLYAEQQGELERALQRYNGSAVPCRLCYAKPDRKAAPPVVTLVMSLPLFRCLCTHAITYCFTILLSLSMATCCASTVDRNETAIILVVLVGAWFRDLHACPNRRERSNSRL